MGIIAKIKIRKLKMVELLTFCEHVLCILKPLQLSSPLFDSFIEKTLTLKLYYEKQQQIKASYLFTVDEEICHASRAFRTMILACTLHPKQEMRERAEAVSKLLPEIINPKRLTHEDLYNQAKLVLKSLKSLPQEQVELLYLTDYLERFKKAITAFIDAYEHRQTVVKECINRDGMALMRSLINITNDLFQYLNLIYQYDMPDTGRKIIEDLNEYIITINAKL